MGLGNGYVRELLFGTPEEQRVEDEYIQKYLKDDWVYQYLPFIVGIVALGFVLVSFYIIDINK